ncbi:hypothetical protein WN943_010573 [Citrus x changshan-huyou]
MFFEVLLNILPSDISNHKLLRWSLKLDEPIEDPSPTDRSGQRNEAKMGKLQDLLKETANVAATGALSVVNDVTSLANSKPSNRMTPQQMAKLLVKRKTIVAARAISKPKTRVTLQRKFDVYSVTWFTCKNVLLNYPAWDYGDDIEPWSKAVQTVLDDKQFVKKWEFHCIPRIDESNLKLSYEGDRRSDDERICMKCSCAAGDDQ